MSADKFAGHTPKPWSLRKDEHGLFMVAWHGMVIAQFIDKTNAELIRAAPELLAENERLNARINSLGDELEMMAYKWGDAEKDDETLRNRVAELEELATDAYLIARVEI